MRVRACVLVNVNFYHYTKAARGLWWGSVVRACVRGRERRRLNDASCHLIDRYLFKLSSIRCAGSSWCECGTVFGYIAVRSDKRGAGYIGAERMR